MSESFQPNYDLFGNEYVCVVKGKGRPEHIPTKENRNKIMLLLAVGWNGARIASSIGMSLPTLRKHYFSELNQRKIARDKVEAVRLQMLWDKAGGGSVPAIKELGRYYDQIDLALDGARFGKSKSAKKPKLGKKELDRRDAPPNPQDAVWGFLANDGDTIQ